MLSLSIVSTIIITIIISMNNNNNCCTEKRAAGATVLPIYVRAPLPPSHTFIYIFYVYNNNILWSLAGDRFYITIQSIPTSIPVEFAAYYIIIIVTVHIIII